MKKIIISLFVMFLGTSFIYAKEIKTSVDIVSVSSSSVTLRVKTFESLGDICYLYRSTDSIVYENYMIIDCNSMYVDDKLESGMTYYYKATEENSDNYSDVVTVTTSDKSSEYDILKRDVSEITNVGGTFFGVIFLMMILLIFSMGKFKKKLN